MRGFGYGVLFFLAATLMPVLEWVALFIAVRKPLLQAMKRAAYAGLFLLVGIFLPMLIWVAFGIVTRMTLLRWWERRAALKPAATRQPRLGALRKVPGVALAFLLVIYSPVLIWVGAAIAIQELLRRWRESRLPSVMVCGTDTHCPPGFICHRGRCVPAY